MRCPFLPLGGHPKAFEFQPSRNEDTMQVREHSSSGVAALRVSLRPTLRLLRSYKRPHRAASDKEEEMKNYIPTTEELQSIAKSELSIMFRKAAEVAADANRDPTERAAAKQTMENVRHYLAQRPAP